MNPIRTMAFSSLLRIVTVAVLAASLKAEPLASPDLRARTDSASVLSACKAIAAAISPASSVYYPGENTLKFLD